MSVVGCDFGSLNTVIAVARNRGVDVITNEVSNRATPTLVGFGPKSRYIGEPAKTAEISNLKNTVSNLTRLAGRKTFQMVPVRDSHGGITYVKEQVKHKDLEKEQEFISAPLCEVDGEIGVEVNYLGQKQKFSATQVIAMYFTKVKETATRELKLPVNDIVISCPAWYTDSQRRALLDAAEIAGLKILRLINETTATALGWGITKTDLPAAEEKPRRIAFVDIGYSNYTASVVEFKKGQLIVKSTVCNRDFGGRTFDLALVKHFAKEFKEKFKIDIDTNPKAKFRVFAAVEKLKKVLSANSTGPINIESLMNDIDVRGALKREEMEQLPEIAALLQKATEPLEAALKEAGLKPDDLDAIEMVGGCTRVPALKNAIQQFFGRPLSFTLNQDEAVARGCAFSCAIHSPVFRVREFSVHDINRYPVIFRFDQEKPGVGPVPSNLTVFSTGNTVPSTKILTFWGKKDMTVQVEYPGPADLPESNAAKEMLSLLPTRTIGAVNINKVQPDALGEEVACKIKVRMNPHGIVTVVEGNIYEKVTEDPSAAAEGKEANADAMDTSPDGEEKSKNEDNPAGTAANDGANDSSNVPAGEKTKDDVPKLARKGPLEIDFVHTASLTIEQKNAAAEQEAQMRSQDKLVKDTEDKKNELESFIYELREKIEGVYAEFSNEQEREKIREKCTTTEDWLYDDGDDATKAVYVSKIEELRAVAAIVIQRYQDKLEEERQARLKREEEEAARRRAAEEARRKAEEEQRKAEEAAKKEQDQEMKDAPGADVE